MLWRDSTRPTSRRVKNANRPEPPICSILSNRSTMAPPSKKRPAAKQAANPDFKRIKAKVGKKAPKPVNETDTTFRSASINVQKQTVADREIGDNKTLVTARGRSIQELTLQLQHPASAARLSASRGLKDLVLGKQTSPEVVQKFLSVLIPAIARCCVDEDDDVRELGLGVLREMIQKLNLVADGNTSISLRPFIPLLIAFVASALNSLDKRTRLDGAAALQILSNAVPILVAPYAIDVFPAFVRILSDRSLQNQGVKTEIENGSSTKGGGKNRSKRSQSPGKSAKGGQHIVLQSLVSLLQSVNTLWRVSRGTMSQQVQALADPDLIFATGGRSRNALFLEGRYSQRRNLLTISSMKDFPSLNELEVHSDQNNPLAKGDTNVKKLLPAPATDLLGKLRDAFVETSQSTTTQDQGTYLVLARAFRLFWESYGNDIFGRYESTDEWEKLRKICLQIKSLILDVFPLRGVALAKEALEEANADLCLLLVGMSSEVLLQNEKEEWTESVLVYVKSSLEKYQTAPDDASRTLMDIFSQLLFLRSGDEFVLGKEPRASMMDSVCSVFFPDGAVDPSIACSTGGRQAILLVREVFESFNYEIERVEAEFGAAAVIISKGLSHYLTAWGSSFPSDSSSVMLLLHDIVRRIDDPNHSLIIDLRSQLEPIVESRSVKGSGKLSGSSILERYPSAHLQRLTVGLFAMLGAPTAKIMAGLSKICARCHSNMDKDCVTQDVATLIMGSLHANRKTMPMQSYLSFIVECTGLTKVEEAALVAKDLIKENTTEARLNWKRILELDTGIQEACRCFTDCGSVKVLPMIFPLLLTWLASSDPAVMTNRDALKTRAALCFLAIFSFDLKSASAHDSIYSLLKDGSEEVVMSAVCRFAQHSPTTPETEAGLATATIRPLLAIFQSEQTLFPKTFAALARDLETMEGAAQANVLTFLLAGIKSAELDVVLRLVSANLLPHAKKTEASLAKGPLEGLARSILAELELMTDGGL